MSQPISNTPFGSTPENSLTSDSRPSPGESSPAPAPYLPDSAVPHTPQNPPPLPPHNVMWAVTTLLFFFPLAFSAFSNASSVFPQWAIGKYAEAEAASRKTRTLGVIALVIGTVLYLVGIPLLMLVLFEVVDSMVQEAVERVNQFSI